MEKLTALQQRQIKKMLESAYVWKWWLQGTMMKLTPDVTGTNFCHCMPVERPRHIILRRRKTGTPGTGWPLSRGAERKRTEEIIQRWEVKWEEHKCRQQTEDEQLKSRKSELECPIATDDNRKDSQMAKGKHFGDAMWRSAICMGIDPLERFSVM